MKKYLLSLVVTVTLLMSIFTCKSHVITEKGDIDSIKKLSDVFVDVRLHPDLFVNKRKVIFDPSSDMQAILMATDATNDTTDDILSSDKFIHDPARIRQIEGSAWTLKESIIDSLRKNLKEEKVPVQIYDVTTDTVLKDQYVLIYSINRYREGEFNLIKNMPSRMTLLSRLVRMENDSETLLYSFKSEYTIKSSIEVPLEQMRIEKMGSLVAKDVAAFIKKVYKSKSREAGNSKKNSKNNNKGLSGDVSADS
jgi:hypothetical protein